MLSLSCKSSLAKEREVKVPPIHANHQTGHLWVLSQLPSQVCTGLGLFQAVVMHRAQPRTWDVLVLPWDPTSTPQQGTMSPGHSHCTRWNLNIAPHGKTNVQHLEGLRVSPLPLVSITSSKMLLLSTQFLVTRRIVYSVPGSRASLG